MVPIGYDDDEPESYSLLIAFDTMAGGGAEFFFCVIEQNHETNTETRYWSGLEVAKFTSDEDRTFILGALLDGTRELLQHNSPKLVFCCTHDSGLPQKALIKHLLVAQVFETCGYVVEEQPIFLGKNSWWMELP